MRSNGINKTRKAHLFPVCGIALFVVLAAFPAVRTTEGSEQSPPSGNGKTHPRIKCVDPTVLFIKDKNNLLQVVDVVVENDSGPEESKYRYTVEATWSLQHYIENRPKEVVDKAAPHKLNQLIVRWSKSGKEETPKRAAIT